MNNLVHSSERFVGQAGREDTERGHERSPGDQDARRLPRQDLVLRPQLRQDHRHRRPRNRGEFVIFQAKHVTSVQGGPSGRGTLQCSLVVNQKGSLSAFGRKFRFRQVPRCFGKN